MFTAKVDVSSFILKVSNAFLPKLVYELEEYGMPRMLSKKIHQSRLVNMEDESMSIHNIIDKFNSIGIENLKHEVYNLHPFDLYILDYFYDGISIS